MSNYLFVVQNIDELHTTAGTKDLLELHGSLFRVRCLDCDEVEETLPVESNIVVMYILIFLCLGITFLCLGLTFQVTENRDSPICKALEGRGAPDPDAPAARILEKVTLTDSEKSFTYYGLCTGSAKVQETFLWWLTEAACCLVR